MRRRAAIRVLGRAVVRLLAAPSANVCYPPHKRRSRPSMTRAQCPAGLRPTRSIAAADQTGDIGRKRNGWFRQQPREAAVRSVTNERHKPAHSRGVGPEVEPLFAT